MTTKDPTTSTRREALFLIIVFFAIVSVGVLFYRHFEGLSWVDAIYYTCVTLTTLGYGDITPQTDISKLFTSIYAFLGVAMFLGVASILFQNALIYSRTHRFRSRKRK